MKVNVTSLDNKKDGDLDLNKDIFGQELRKDILFRVVEWQRAKKQSGNHKTKERGEIACTNKKPFAQKGTGNARQGSNAAPHMRGGATVMGPKVRSHAHSLPKKVRQLGLKVALSYKLSSGTLTVLNDAKVKSLKTSDLSTKLDKLGLQKSSLIVDSNIDENLQSASRNLKNLNVLPQAGLNVLDILKHENLLITKDAITEIEKRFA